MVPFDNRRSRPDSIESRWADPGYEGEVQADPPV